MPDDVIDAPADAGQPSDDQSNPGKAPADNAGGDKPLADGGGRDDGPVSTPADWPEDWRTRLAGGDEKALKRLERFKSPADIYKSFLNADAKIASGQMKPTLPDDATEDQIAAYRKDLGVPEKPDDYLKALPNGLVIGDDDKSGVSSFLASAHKANMSPEHVGAALDWYQSLKEEAATAMATGDKQFRVTAEDELRSEWGEEYRMNMNAQKAFFDATPVVGKDEDGKDVTLGMMMRGSRMPDGTLLGDNPKFLRWAVDLANKENPAGFVSPSGGMGQVESLETERDAMQKRMREDPAWPRDSKAHARYEQVVNAISKLKP